MDDMWAERRWRQIIDKSIPRNDIMEIAWENIPAAWEQEMAALRVGLPLTSVT